MEYKCPQCDKSFGRKALLNRHTARVHTKDTKPKPTQEKSEGGNKFELANTDDSAMTYECGGCGAKLDGEVSPCPHCGAELDW